MNQKTTHEGRLTQLITYGYECFCMRSAHLYKSSPLRPLQSGAFPGCIVRVSFIFQGQGRPHRNDSKLGWPPHCKHQDFLAMFLNIFTLYHQWFSFPSFPSRLSFYIGLLSGACSSPLWSSRRAADRAEYKLH